MKRICTLLLTMALTLSLTAPAALAERVTQDYHEGLAAFCEDGKWGYLDEAGGVAIPARFEYAYDFQGGLARVRLDGREGMIDLSGKLVVPYRYQRIDAFTDDGVALIMRDGKYGLLNMALEEIVPPAYLNEIFFQDGLARVALEWGDGRTSGMWGVIDRTGKAIVPTVYDEVRCGELPDGWFAVEQGGLFGALDAEGQERYPCAFRTFEALRTGVERGDPDPFAALDDPAMEGLPVTWFPQYRVLMDIIDADRMVVWTMDGDALLTDFHGVPVTGEHYDAINTGAADDGAVLATKGGHTGILFPDGTFTIPEGCDSVVMRARDGEFLEVSLNNVHRVIRRDGTLVALLDSVGATYGSAHAFHGNYALLFGWDPRFGARWYGVVDGDGNDAIPKGTYSFIWPGESGLIVYDGAGCGLVDWDGTVILPVMAEVQPEGDENDPMPPSEEALYTAAGLPWPGEKGGLHPYSTEDTPYGYRGDMGAFDIPQVFDWADEFAHGYSVVSYGGYYGLLKDPRNADKVSAWAQAEVDEARELGLVTERTDSYYTYDVTRLQFAELAVDLVEKATGKAAAPAEADRFTDITDETALKAAALGVVTGTGDGSTFAPDDLITREQLATMLYRTVAVIYRERDGLDFTPVSTDLSAFADGGRVSGWAAQAVSQCAAWGILEGGPGGAVQPQENTTLEQAILLVLRAYRMG